MHVAQVDIRLGETTLDRTWIAAGKQFCIGSNPGVDFAVAGIGTFPLVTGYASGFLVRAPVGTPLAIGGRTAHGSELWLAPGSTVELALGLARISIALAEPPRVQVPRPELDARPAWFATLSLAAHLGVWATAITVAPGSPHTTSRRVLAHIGTRHSFATDSRQARPAVQDAVAPDLPQPQMLDEPPTPAPTLQPRTPSRSTATTEQEESGAGPAPAGEDVAMAAASDHAVSFDREQLYIPDLAPGFGTTRSSFDPMQRPEYQTIAAGPYTTLARGEHAGSTYDFGRDFKLSLDPGGSIADPITAQAFRDVLDHVSSAGVHCGVADGPLVRRVTIQGNGRPVQIEDLEGRTHDDCASRILASIEFPATGRETVAMISIGRAP